MSVIPSDFEIYDDFNNIDDVIDFYKSYSTQFHEVLLQIRDLLFLEELAIFDLYDINKSYEKIYIKSLYNLKDLETDIISLL